MIGFTISKFLLVAILLTAGVNATIPWNDLKLAIAGNVLLPGDAAYHAIRDDVLTLPAEIPDDQPLAIVQPINASDVRQVMLFANVNNIPQVTALAGGHGNDGFSFPLDGIQIQFGLMTNIEVDAVNNVGSFEPGVLVGNVTEALAPFNRGHTVGNCNHIGNAGYVSVGGFGFWTRLKGMGVDNVVEYEIVTAAGDILTVNDNENSDLFFALRGALPAYGIATRIKFKIFDTTDFYGGILYYRFPNSSIAHDALSQWFGTVLNTPDLVDNRYFQTRANPFNRFASYISISFEVIFLGSDTIEEKKAKLLPLFNATDIDFFPEFLDPGRDEPVFFPVSYRDYNNFNLDANVIRWQLPFLNNLEQYRLHGMVSEARIQEPGVFEDLMEQFIRGFNFSEPSSTNQIGELALSGKRVAEIPKNDIAFAARDFGFLWSYSLAYPSPETFDAAREWIDPIILKLRTIGQSRSIYGNYNTIRFNRGTYDGLGTNMPRLESIKETYDPTNRFSRSWKLTPGVGEDCVNATEAKIKIKSNDDLKFEMEFDYASIDFGALDTDGYLSFALYDPDYTEIGLYDFEWWANKWEPKFNGGGDVRKWKYDDSPDSNSDVDIKDVDEDDPRIKMNLKSSAFTLPTLPLTLPLYARIELGTKTCLQVTFENADKNTASQFKADFDEDDDD